MRTSTLGRVGAALALGVGGYVHFRVWQIDYRHAPVREMFVANWVLSAVVAVLLLVVVAGRLPERIDRVALISATLLALGSLAAFAMSRGPGLPTLHGTFKEHGLETTGDYLFGMGSAKAVLISETVAAILSGWVLAASVPLPGVRRRVPAYR